MMPLSHSVPVCLCRELNRLILIESSNRCSCLPRKKVCFIFFVETWDKLANLFENAGSLR